MIDESTVTAMHPIATRNSLRGIPAMVAAWSGDKIPCSSSASAIANRAFSSFMLSGISNVSVFIVVHLCQSALTGESSNINQGNCTLPV